MCPAKSEATLTLLDWRFASHLSCALRLSPQCLLRAVVLALVP